MGGGRFAEAIASLLDAYTRCIHLLGSLNRNGREGQGGAELDQLQAAVRSDRAKVRRAYASSLRTDGRSFERGDGESLASLGAIVARLSCVTDRILGRFAKSRKSDLTPESLALLSNSSRADALRTMSQLSFRLSRLLPADGKGHQANHGTHGERRGKHHKINGSRHSLSSSRISNRAPTPISNHAPSPISNRCPRRPRSKAGHDGQGRIDQCSSGCERCPRRKSTASLSRATASTGSTKLGEVRPKRRRRRRGHPEEPNSNKSTASSPSPTATTHLSMATLATTDTWCTYDVKPTYPLHPYAREPKSRGFLGIFRRQ